MPGASAWSRRPSRPRSWLVGQRFGHRLRESVEFLVAEFGVRGDEDDLGDRLLGSSGPQVWPVRWSGNGVDAAGGRCGIETFAAKVRHQSVAIRRQDGEDPVRRVDRG